MKHIILHIPCTLVAPKVLHLVRILLMGRNEKRDCIICGQVSSLPIGEDRKVKAFETFIAIAYS